MKREIREEIERISPNFPLAKKKRFETLPDGYFEGFQEKMIQKLQKEQTSGQRKGRQFFLMVRRIAAVLLFGVVGWFLIKQIGPGKILDSDTIKLSREDALAYALENPNELGMILYEITDNLDDENLFEIPFNEEWAPEEMDALIDQYPIDDIEEIL